MDNIIEPNDTFEFTNLSLAHPTGIQGGAYFTKIEYNKKPLYIQTCKSQTRQGFVKTGKKYYCDLMFDKNAETLVNWFENLEERCRKLIFEKRDTWFQNSLEETDIESAFNSVMRIYKSGKYYLVRTNIKNNHANLPSVKIYNEHEQTLAMEDITNDTNIISILEIQGIKFTSRNFQIEIELKQVMVLDNEPIFESCLIKTNKKASIQLSTEKDVVGENGDKQGEIDLEKNHVEPTTEYECSSSDILKDLSVLNVINNDINNDTTNETLSGNILSELEKLEPIDIMVSDDNVKENSSDKNDDISFDLEIEDLDKDIEEQNNELEEIETTNIDLETSLETMHLKKPNQVYFELYKEARTKAKAAKRNAILAYLEAKNIKKTYMIENLNDSDSDFDAEIDEVSESELDDI
jgi:hypothetical protein